MSGIYLYIIYILKYLIGIYIKIKFIKKETTSFLINQQTLKLKNLIYIKIKYILTIFRTKTKQ